MIHISKMGDRMSPDDKDIESKYRIQGKIYRVDRDKENKVVVSLFFDLKDLEFITKELNQEVEKQYNKRLDELTGAESIKF